MTSGLAGWVDRVVALRAPRSPAVRAALLAVAVALFAVLVVLAVRALPDDLDVRWGFVALAAATVPVTVAVNALEYRRLAALADTDLTASESWRVSLAASAANLLPVPGSVAIRAAHLRRRGAAYGAIGRATSAVAATYLGVALAGAGALVVAEAPLTGAVAIGLGLAAGAGAFLLARDGPWLAGVAVVEVASVAVGGLRLFLLLAALDEASAAGAAGLVLADVLAAMVGFLPGGLGLREVLAGLLGPLADVPAATAVVATALDRVIVVVTVGGLAMASGWRPSRGGAAAAAAPGGSAAAADGELGGG